MNDEVASATRPSFPKSLNGKKIDKKTLIGLTIGLILIICLGGYAVYRYLHAKNLAQDPAAVQQVQQKVAQEEAKKLVTEISRIMVLPSDELPTVAVVSDIEKLKDQLFFQKAKNGDKVLIFPTAKVAINH